MLLLSALDGLDKLDGMARLGHQIGHQMAEFERQIKIEQKKQLLTIAKRELSKVTNKLLDDELSLMSATIGCTFYVGSNHGVTGTDFLGMTSLEIFNKKLEKVLAERVDYEFVILFQNFF
ncbi:hypothetical protein niasHT_021563 [Heterodera trifolii]|uniref:Uncharacterized protein n=1 Tax=Heterodera trifolii TaxID=157864 RepID=A0ABD2KRU9_9BILA